MSTTITCPVPGCGYAIGPISEALAVALLNAHTTVHTHPPSTTSTAPSSGPIPIDRGPKPERPKVDIGVSAEEWNLFERRWSLFKKCAGIDASMECPQLFQCATEALGDAILKVDPTITDKPVADLLATMKSLAVIPVATGVLRAELLAMHQKRDEPYRTFLSRVRGRAEICSYVVKNTCDCGKLNNVDFTDVVIRDVLIAGIYDIDIRRKILSIPDITSKPVNDIVSMVAVEEMARDALPSNAMTSTLSSTKKDNMRPPANADRNRKSLCPHCNNSFPVFTEGPKGWNSKPHPMCLDCYRARRRRNRQVTSSKSENASIVTQMCSIEYPRPIHNEVTQNSNSTRRQRLSKPCESRSLRLSHHIFTRGEWRKMKFLAHPTVKLSLSTEKRDYCSFKAECPVVQPVFINAIADTGAQSNLWSLQDCLDAGYSRDDLLPVDMSLSAANKSAITITGALLTHLSGDTSSGGTVSCPTMVYVSPSVTGFYLSYETMIDLGIINNEFPSVGSVFHADVSGLETNEVLSPSLVNGDIDKICDCPERGSVPPMPMKLPFEPIPDNNEKMRSWLLETFKASTFNTCPHRPLPQMTGPPLEIHLDDGAIPKACHTPATIPLHWQQQVKADLDRDEALGVIEKVPYGEPVTWCHRMVVTRKHDGSPRRTVDLSPLNRYCKRETFASETPFHLARRIPKGTWKSVTDAWNGYHSVPLLEAHRHLTTFVTPFGRYRCKRAPQGFVSSGDGYNRRFDSVLADFERKERCVDDTIHYDDNLEDHWWRTIEFLRRTGEAGIVLNSSKFQFAQKSVVFAGFRIKESSIEPLPKFLDAIRHFPVPANISDIRSWFGLVNQVANYGQLRDIMAPFRPFLSPKHPFQWTSELSKAFQESKDSIVAAISHGVEIFDMSKPTCLRPDWSRQGIGYFLTQKNCPCPSATPDCCDNGWQVTLAGSRFLSSAEQRYAPIEGEALAVAWGLEQSKYFTQGCDNLLVATDHKPLVKILGDRTLDEISNTRLFRLKQRTLPWRFKIVHLPGKSNHAADATSRHPSRYEDITDESHIASLDLFTEGDREESFIVSAIARDASEFFSLSWHDLRLATSKDETLNSLIHHIDKGFPTQRSQLDMRLSAFWSIRDALHVQEGVVLYNDRAIIPSSLRASAISILHSAHQGIAAMESRARRILYWPGITKDIRLARESCIECCRNAPSQPAMPSTEPRIPSTPFDAIVADFFETQGHHFLVAADRLSGWVEVFSAPVKTVTSGANGLVQHLRSFFSIFGVPEEISTDGGPEFVSSIAQEFFARWGIRHRRSSAYFPQSNGRAEVAVKTAKRLLLSNITPSGSINSDKFLRAILQLRNTPDPDCHISPAEIVFGRRLRDAFTFVNKSERFQNPEIRSTWRDAWEAKEEALRVRFAKSSERMDIHTRDLPPLLIGDRVFVQNQNGTHPLKWDRSGLVVEVQNHDQYVIKIDGSGRLTLRNRRFLRRYSPARSSFAPTTVQVQDLPPSPSTMPAPPLTDDMITNDPPQALDPLSSSDDTPVSPKENVPTPSSIPAWEAVRSTSNRPRRICLPRKFYDASSGVWTTTRIT